MIRKAITWVLLLSLAGCVTVQPGKKQRKVEGQAGRVIDSIGLLIDANYDPRLDHVIRGYKVLPVDIKNNSLRAISMDVKEDRWVIVSEKGKSYRAINSLRLKDPLVWRATPEKVRNMVDYPEIIPIDYNVTFDLFFSPQDKLEYFGEIHYYNAALKQEFVLEKLY